MPQKPYFPLGTLREAYALSENPEGIDDEGLREALHKVGLIICAVGSTRPNAGITSCRAANSNAWPSPGADPEAALGVHGRGEPRRWTKRARSNVMRLLADELPDTAVVSIGHRPGLEAFHTRELVLEPGDEGAQLRARPGQRGLRASIAGCRPPAGPRDPGRLLPAFRRTFIGR